jgi:prepilin-type N-terminal cleavage/methylation domain-containing protein
MSSRAAAISSTPHRRAFSLTEVIFVCLIIGILTAIAIPRLSRSSAGAQDSALSSDLAILRTAIENYSSDHKGAFPPFANFAAAMTQYTDPAGNVSSTRTSTAIYGPYIPAIPALPASSKKGGAELASPGMNDRNSGRYGWIYDETTGAIAPNTMNEQDATGKLYASY